MTTESPNLRYAGREQRSMESLFVREWLAQLGLRMAGERLWTALGFKSRRSFERAARDKLLGVQLYPNPTGRGRFAATEEVARWVWKQMELKKSGGRRHDVAKNNTS